jgi:hypothetical protein
VKGEKGLARDHEHRVICTKEAGEDAYDIQHEVNDATSCLYAQSLGSLRCFQAEDIRSRVYTSALSKVSPLRSESGLASFELIDKTYLSEAQLL